MNDRLVGFSIALLLVFLAGPAFGALIFFGEDDAGGMLPVPNSDGAQADFLSNLDPGVGVEDFEGFAGNESLPLNINLGSTTATLTGGGELHDFDGGIFAISPTNHLATFDGFTLTFDAPQVAFGFYGTDVGDFGGQLSLSFNGGAGLEIPHTIGASGSTNGTAFFWGIIDTANPFTSIEFINSDTSDEFGFDNFTVGDITQVAPEPTSLTLFVLGLALIGIRRRV